jgi:hypothetical protein
MQLLARQGALDGAPESPFPSCHHVAPGLHEARHWTVTEFDALPQHCIGDAYVDSDRITGLTENIVSVRE